VSIRRLTRWIMTRPRTPAYAAAGPPRQAGRCLPALAEHAAAFAHLITARDGDLQEWIDTVRADDLPALHAFIHGLQVDYRAVQAGLTVPYSNGPTEGINNKIKLLKRQMYGRAGFPLLRQRILLNQPPP
jgi:transposase